MKLSWKCQYALLAVFELGKRWPGGPASVADIAAAQAIPHRFGELILGELRQGGFVESRRGVRGGYVLAVAPGQLTVGEIVRFVEGQIEPVRCLAGEEAADRAMQGRHAFLGLWRRVHQAVSDVYDRTTFADLLQEEQAAAGVLAAEYCI